MLAMISTFLAGADTLGFMVAALLFLRAWKRTRDLLFLAFCAAFALLALNQLVSSIMRMQTGETAWAYLLRLAAFLLLIVAIIHKNLGSRGRTP